MIQFFGSNIECIEYQSHVHRIFKAPVAYRGIIQSLVNGLVFIMSFEKDYKYCFINFCCLQQEVFPIFKLLNSTEAAYDN